MLNKLKFLKKPKTILILIILSTAFLRLYRLDFPNKYVFDEVYHAFTAREYLKGSKEAWEWWTKPPPGVAYEWTHPPLAKEMMTASMFLSHSQDGWAWRLPGALLGSLSVYLIFLLGLNLLKSESASLLAAFIFSIDGLNFVQSRIGMNDIYMITFMLASLLFFVRKKYFLSALLVGLSFASKWSAIYLFCMYLLIFLYDVFKLNDKSPLNIIKKYGRPTIYFIAIPLIIYLFSYLPFFLLGHSFDQFKQLQQQMWWYHTGLKATHTYSSPWWSWPLNLYPVWYFVDYQKNNVANIFTSGNTAVFWVGIGTLILTLWEAIKKRSSNLLIIITGFLVFWLPWSISPRIMFLYHFSPSVPFLALSLAYQLNMQLVDKKGRKLVIILLLLMIINFVLFFPMLTGIPIPRKFVNLFFVTNLSKNPF